MALEGREVEVLRVWIAFGTGAGDVPPLQAARAEAVLEGGGAVVCVDNLACRAASGRTALPPVLFDGRSVGLVSERPRAVKALLRFAGVPMEGRDLRWARAVATDADRREFHGMKPLADESEWIPWYPVVDADRCIRCGQCVRFCLFSVYRSLPDGLPEVVNPRNCKNLCPACARICPAAAIIFPRYTESPFNGDEVPEGDIRILQQKEDLRRLLGDDPVAALRDRQRKSRPLIDEARLEEALAERARHLDRDGTEGGA